MFLGLLGVIDARRNLAGVCMWALVSCGLGYQFFIAISRAAVSCDDGGGTAPEFGLLVLSLSGVGLRTRFEVGPCCLEHWLFGLVTGLTFFHLLFLLRMWPCSAGFLFKWVIFFGYLALASCCGGPWVRCVFLFIELLILYERCAGERLVLEKAVPRHPRPGRPISVSAVPFGPGIDIWRSCRFIGALSRSLCALPGSIGWFIALFGWC